MSKRDLGSVCGAMSCCGAQRRELCTCELVQESCATCGTSESIHLLERVAACVARLGDAGVAAACAIVVNACFTLWGVREHKVCKFCRWQMRPRVRRLAALRVHIHYSFTCMLRFIRPPAAHISVLQCRENCHPNNLN